VDLEVFVIRSWTDRAFDHLTNGIDGCPFPDADAEFMVAGIGTVGNATWDARQTSSALASAAWVKDSMDDCDEHRWPLNS
jgi:hypothetical protein